MTGQRLREILESRGVTGVIFVGMMRENRLPNPSRRSWNISLRRDGVRTASPPVLRCAITTYGPARL
jgi:hypothetical protein